VFIGTAGKDGIRLSVGLCTGGAADMVRVVKRGDKGSELPLMADGEICCAISLPGMSSYNDGLGSSYLFCLLVGETVSVGEVGNGSLDIFCRCSQMKHTTQNILRLAHNIYKM